MRTERPTTEEKRAGGMYLALYGWALAGERTGRAVTGARGGRWEAETRIGDEVYYSEFAEIPPTLHGPYKVMDIRKVELNDEEGTVYRRTEVYLDRYDCLTPVPPGSIYRADMVEKYLKNNH